MSGGPAAGASRPGGFGRIAAIGALVLAVIAIAWIILGGGDDGYEYELVFETGGQLVEDNQVLIGGAPVGTVNSIELTDNGQAEVGITVDRQLHEGTSAVIRSTSLSGVANRYISITPGPDNAPALDDGALITQVDTTSPVDIDQLFNALRAPERKGLQDFIQGSATTYAGRGEEANESYRFISPALVATDKLINEVNSDQRTLTEFLVSGGRVMTSLAERRDDLTNLVSNANSFLGAIASENEAFSRALVALPPALRQANTTFFNLRGALDDLDPLVETAKPATRNLAPFLRQLRPVIGKSVPVFHDLRLSVNRKGDNNDFADAAGKLTTLQARAASAVPRAVSAMADADDVLQFYRSYSPDLFQALAKVNAVAGYYDANGHYIRATAAGMNIFNFAGGNLVPIPAAEQYDAYCTPAGAPDACDYVPPASFANMRVYERCPGSGTQAIPGSNPFTAPPFAGFPVGAPATPADCIAGDRPLP